MEPMDASTSAEEMSAVQKLSYANKLMLAPMVRIGTLPSRLLALQYGADIVYTEELIDHKMITCRRLENALLGTIDFVSPSGSVVLRTCTTEKDRVVFQMGTSDPDRALQAAKLVAEDVAGIDVNMGCPKPFSIKGGMGAALLHEPDKVKNILTTLVQGLPHKPITCKIRLLPSEEATMSLVKTIESTGVAAIGVHGRYQAQRPREPLSEGQIKLIKKVAESVSIPVIANGGSLDIEKYSDIAPFQDATGCSAIMIARAAQWNMSVFRAEGQLSTYEVLREYVRLAFTTGNAKENSKYCLMTTLRKEQTTPLGKAITSAKTMRELCTAVNLEAEFDTFMETLRNTHQQPDLSYESLTEHPSQIQDEDAQEKPSKRARRENSEEESNTVKIDLKYNPKEHPQGREPKTRLMQHCRATKVEPTYETVPHPEKGFKSYLRMGTTYYTTTNPQANKKKAEQASALVYLQAHNL